MYEGEETVNTNHILIYFSSEEHVVHVAGPQVSRELQVHNYFSGLKSCESHQDSNNPHTQGFIEIPNSQTSITSY